MQCKELEAVLESDGLSPLPVEAREHLAGCVGCQDFLADLSAIVVAAKTIPAEVNPPDRIWVSVRAQLEAEGIIRDSQPVAVPAETPWWNGFSEFFRPRVLASVGAVLFVGLGTMYVVQHRNLSDVAHHMQNAPVQAPVQTQASVKTQATTPTVTTPAAASENSVVTPQQVVAQKNVTPQPKPSTVVLQPSPTEVKDVYQGDSAGGVLSETEGSLRSHSLSNNAEVDASLRQNLRTINDFIAECKTRLKQNPQDQLAREYLNMAYQQKAELLNAMMDSGRSEH
jgi:hypothetical protein